jgi:hypothetical protein
MDVLVNLGFPYEYVVETLMYNKANYCLAAYYLLGTDQNF